MLKKEDADIVKGATGVGDEVVDKFHKSQEKIFGSIQKFMKCRIVAEVVRSERCFAGVEVGDKIVFDPMLNREESIGTLCPRALLPVLMQVSGIWESIIEWGDSGREEPLKVAWQYIRCLDPGITDGGLGDVVYQLRVEMMDD